MLVWVNTHGGFLAGLMMLVAGVLIEGALALGLGHGNDQLGARARVLHLIPLTVAAWVCTLVNPYGWKIYTWVLQLLGNPYFMQFNGEWHSPDFRLLGASGGHWGKFVGGWGVVSSSMEGPHPNLPPVATGEGICFV